MATRISLLSLATVFFGILAVSAPPAAAKDDSAITIRFSKKRPTVEYLLARPISAKNKALMEKQAILPILAKQSQSPQPVIIKNYYLTAQAKKEVLPFWQGPRPLRLRNQFVK